MTLKLKFAMILVLISLNSTGCSNNTWDSIVNREFSNMDNWAGSGFYFYEVEDEKYCTYMIYGSGVPFAGEFTSKIIDDTGKMMIKFPIEGAEIFFEVDNRDTQETVSLELEYIDDEIHVNGIVFRETDGIENHKYIENSIQ